VINRNYQPPCVSCSQQVRAVCVTACEDYDSYITRLERELDERETHRHQMRLLNAILSSQNPTSDANFVKVNSIEEERKIIRGLNGR